ncbi:EpsG family protein [Cellulophaga sp. F20128]|uniref:EpsG family protein n=1 Tax=Cellulophaga sp. F20128 TaxID=2926413 RepID=UPI001FF1F852|nr:EpsG family protein [Cellulophaga sp. F20128]MCK0156851.1 EpsG family protein [Cellulophaga sp. F20128]
MDTLIPMENYYDVYINTCLFLVLFTIFHTLVLKIDSPKNQIFIQFSGFTLLVILIFFMGQRPINGYYFGDTINYYRAYTAYQYGADIKEGVGDWGWHLFMKSAAQLMSVHTFFTIIEFLYIYPMYRISKAFFKEYWYYAFLMFVVSFSFWTYGVNGIRNGAAASLFLWGVSYHRKKILMIGFFLLAIQFHKTLLLPILAFAVTFLYNNPKVYLKGWLACIPLSLVMGGVWIALFASLGFGGDDRLSAYLSTEAAEGTSSTTGFRWDFIFYSAFAVVAGWYFIIKRNYKDQMYFQLFNTYLICNGFWILIIRANYSNRFAYLSWFMMAVVIIYPMLKQQFFKNQHFMIGKIILAYFGFTYLMYKIYYG